VKFCLNKGEPSSKSKIFTHR